MFDKKGSFNDFAGLDGGDSNFRKVLLKNSKPRLGAFARMFGDSEIQLVQVDSIANQEGSNFDHSLQILPSCIMCQVLLPVFPG